MKADTRRLNADDNGIAVAGRMLALGRLVAMPTETVYGLAADATNGEAVARIFEAKRRPRFNPLIVHVADVAEAGELCHLDPDALLLAEQFWPGPLTLVLRRRATCPVSELVSAGLPTLAVRVPGHDTASAIIRCAGRPIAAPSANLSGAVSPTTAAHVIADLDGRIDAVLDAGPCVVGVESTILDVSNTAVEGPAILRPGGLPAERIAAVLGRPLVEFGGPADRLLSPGMMASHYAPQARIRLNVKSPEPGESLLAFGAVVPATCAPTINLSPSSDLREAAAKLFAALRQLDSDDCRSIAVMPIPGEGLGEAINDRLLRAAAPRPAGP